MATQAQTAHLTRMQEAHSPLAAAASSPSSSSSALTPSSVSPRRVKRRSPAPVLARWNFEVDDMVEVPQTVSSPVPARIITPSKLSIQRSLESSTAEELANRIQSLDLYPAQGTAIDPAKAPGSDGDPSGPHSTISRHSGHSPEAQSSSYPSAPPLDISASLTQAFDEIAEVRSHVFQLEEKRHSGAPLADGEAELAIIQIDARLESISIIVQRLEASLASDTLEESDEALGNQRASFDELVSEWMSVQVEVDGLKKELSDTKYLEHFQSFSRQVTDIMDSLERAVMECTLFVASFRRQSVAILKGPGDDHDDDDHEDEKVREMHRLRQFEAARKSFKTKASYYIAPCEQTFTSFERSLRDRGTSHGTVLRQLGDLKQRWRGLKERSAKVERDLKKVERTLANAEQSEAKDTIKSAASGQVVSATADASSVAMRSPLLPINSAKRSQLSVGGKPSTSIVQLSGASFPRSPLPADSSLPSTPLKITTTSQHASSYGLPPTSPAERFPGQLPASGGLMRSPASSGLHLVPGSMHRIPSASSQTHAFPTSISRATTQEEYATKPVGQGSSPRTAAKRLSAAPETLRGDVSVSRRRLSGVGAAPSTPNQAPSSYRFASDNLGTSADREIAHRSDANQPVTPAHRSGPEEEVETLASRPASRASLAQQTLNTPVAAAGKPAVRRMSRIPTLTPRSSSAMSTSRPPPLPTSTPKTPGMNRLRETSRSTMQTPEPVIAARVMGLSVYSRPSTGGHSTSSLSNKESGGVGTTTPRRKALGSQGSRPPVTRSSVPPIPSLRASGRTTPLSASALAKIPHATPMSLSLPAASSPGGRSASVSASLPRPPSVAGSSVANFRASRASIISGGGLLGTPSSKRSARDESATPTFSEGGYSSISLGGGGGMGGSLAPSSIGGRTSRAGSLAPTSSAFPYRANPNDPLDVAISMITNNQGIYLTREDPPLPRGHTLQTGPGKEIRGRYRFGNRKEIMTCKLLQLHKPARASALVTRRMQEEGIDCSGVQTKVLVKVPRQGFLDLKVWLSSSFAQQQMFHDDEGDDGDDEYNRREWMTGDMTRDQDEGNLSIVSRTADESLGETF